MRLSQLARMAGFTKAQPEDEGVTPLDVIFSCSVCNATFSEVYEGHSEYVQGLSDGINPNERLVTRLFLANCCHVFCSKHLEGGAAPPFHPAGSRPHAACPVCKKDGELYSIRGFKPGEYDGAIPACWFVTPPIKLDSSGKEMEALRFQYMSLVTYSKQIFKTQKRAETELAKTQHTLEEMQTLASEEHAKVLTLEQEVERLRPMEPELQKLKKRMPTIENYLKLIPTIVEQNEQMRNRLASLGFQMPLEPLPYNKEKSPLEEIEYDNDDMREFGVSPERPASHFTGGTSANTLVDPELAMSSSSEARPIKRKRIGTPRPGQNIHAPPPQQRGLASRDLMPPPAGPLSRMRSIKKLWPTLRKKGSSGQASPAYSNEHAPASHAQTHSNEHAPYMDSISNASNGYDRPLTRHGYPRSETPYMTGALPVGQPPHPTESPQPRMIPSGANAAGAGFTFRSAIQPTPKQDGALPIEPSYIHLMDDLSRDNRVDLGLTDPRHNANSHTRQQNHDSRHQNVQQSPAHPNGTDASKRWSYGHPFLEQSPKGPSASTYRHPDALRSNPIRDGNDRTMQDTCADPITPASKQLQHQTRPEENEVSPFFESSNRKFQYYPRGGVAEREDRSLRRSDDYRYQKPTRIWTEQTDWHEPRGLNGLSFFQSPLNTRNEPIEHTHGCVRENSYVAPEQHYMSRNVTSRGFLTKPDIWRSPLLHDSGYGSVQRLSHSRQVHALSQSATPFSSWSRRSQSRATRLPTSMPSIVSSGRSTARSSRDWKRLSDVGVRRVHGSRSHIPGNTFVSPTRNLFSSAGRRTVRR